VENLNSQFLDNRKNEGDLATKAEERGRVPRKGIGKMRAQCPMIAARFPKNKRENPTKTNSGTGVGGLPKK